MMNELVTEMSAILTVLKFLPFCDGENTFQWRLLFEFSRVNRNTRGDDISFLEFAPGS